MAKIGEKLLNFIGLEPTDEEEYDDEFEEQEMMDDDMSFPPDDYEPGLPPGAANLIPVCMASSLFKDDDASISSMLWNEYAQRLEALWSDAARAGKAEYVCTTGWI